MKNDLVFDGIVKGEGTKIYIYGINQILVSVLNVASALIIGWIFGVLLEIAVFMAAYIPLRSFAGRYHAKTPLRCYIFSVVMLTIVSIGIKYLYVLDLVYYFALTIVNVIAFLFSSVENKNKLLGKIEQKVYKKRILIISAAEFVICLVFRLINLNRLLIAVTYSFVM